MYVRSVLTGSSMLEEEPGPSTPLETVAAPSPAATPTQPPAKPDEPTPPLEAAKKVPYQFSNSASTLVLGALNSQSSFEETQDDPDPVKTFLEHAVDQQLKDEEELKKREPESTLAQQQEAELQRFMQNQAATTQAPAAAEATAPESETEDADSLMAKARVLLAKQKAEALLAQQQAEMEA